jgi:hypothetical protein
MGQQLAHRLGDRPLAGDTTQLLVEERLEGIDDRLALVLASLAAFVGRSAANGVLDPLERGDAAQHRLGDRRGGGALEVDEVPPSVRPAIGERRRADRGLAGRSRPWWRPLGRSGA